MERIARHLDITLYAFRRRYVVKDPDGHASLAMRDNGDCVFWNEGCDIYSVRPRQCRTFPFWSENLGSPDNLGRSAAHLPRRGQRKTLQVGRDPVYFERAENVE